MFLTTFSNVTLFPGVSFSVSPLLQALLALSAPAPLTQRPLTPPSFVLPAENPGSPSPEVFPTVLGCFAVEINASLPVNPASCLESAAASLSCEFQEFFAPEAAPIVLLSDASHHPSKPCSTAPPPGSAATFPLYKSVTCNCRTLSKCDANPFCF